MYLQPTSNALSGPDDPTRLSAVAPLIAGLESLKIALVFVFVAITCGVDAQTYNVGPDASKTPQAQANQTQSTGPAAGLGIEYSKCAPCAGCSVSSAAREPRARA